jgi:endonuclease/exonuclease/phosphatase family metal-dependent hydrolase
MGFKSIVAALIILVSLSAQAKLRFATYNIRNFDYDERSQTPTNKNQLKNTLKNINADLLAVQEINEAFVFESFVRNNFYKYDVALSECGGSHGQKLGFVYDTSKFKLVEFKEDFRTVNPKKTGNTVCQGSRPLAIARFKMKKSNEELIAISVHLKAGGHKKSIAKRFAQLEILTKVVRYYQAKGIRNVVVMGDFNSTEYYYKSKEYRRFVRVVSEMDMIDTSKEIKCTSYWWGGEEDGQQYPSILDHVLVSPALAKGKTPKAKPLAHCQKLSCNINSEYDMGINFDEVSDHCPVVTEIK